MSKNGRKWAMGALIAGAAGYVAGILTAPKSGKETREDIKQATSKATREGEKQLKALYQELSDLALDMRDRASEYSGKGKKEYEELSGKLGKARDKIKEMISAVREGDVEDPELQAAIDDVESLKAHVKKYLKKP
jgi:gas vesicle protein